MWIARSKKVGVDSKGKDITDLYLYYYKPVKTKNIFHCAYKDIYRCYYLIDSRLFPEVTFENSPQEVEIKIKQR